MTAMDSKQAAAYLIDPLNAPEPSAETGPGASFRPAPEAGNSSTNPFRNGSRHSSGGHARVSSNGSNKFPAYRDEAFKDLNDNGHRRRSHEQNGPPPSYDDVSSGGRRRTSSLKERYPGDTSHRPLDIIRKDSKKANKSPHLQRRHIPGADSIDRLDPTINKIPYHHEGPYDAALLARNTSFEHSPIAALKDSNEEALRATATEHVKDSVDKHQPLDGVADVPPGQPDRFGRQYMYREGSNLFLAKGVNDYKQYGGLDYHPDDIKGKGEPQFSEDRRAREQHAREQNIDGHAAIEMSDRPLMSDYEASKKDHSPKQNQRSSVDMVDADQHERDTRGEAVGSSSGHGIGGSIKKRIGSLRKKNSQ